MNTENMQVETTESAVGAEVTTSAEIDVFDNSWEDDGFTEVDKDSLEVEETEAENAEADQQNAEEAENAENSETEAQTEEGKEEKADQRFTLKHLDEVREVDRDEVIVLAQKGMDYDRKTAMLNDTIANYEEFLKELCPEGLTIEDLMDMTRARMLQESEREKGNELSETDALLRVQRQRAENRKAAKEKAQNTEQQQKEAAEHKQKADINNFVAAYPDVKAADIPKSVWDEVNKGSDLLSAYTRYENKMLRDENKALKQNEKNKSRSTGSRKTEGAAAAKDAFDAVWD